LITEIKLEGHSRVKTTPTKLLLVHPEARAFGAGLCFAVVYFFPREISELCWPITTKFCTMLGSVFDFIIPVQNFEGASPKKF